MTTQFAEKAASIDSTSSVAMAEVGYQNLLRGRVKEAQRYYKSATKLDESSIQALSGIISCQLLDKQFDIAKEQLDFLKEIQGGQVNKAEILYMNAVLGRYTQVGKQIFVYCQIKIQCNDEMCQNVISSMINRSTLMR